MGGGAQMVTNWTVCEPWQGISTPLVRSIRAVGRIDNRQQTPEHRGHLHHGKKRKS